MSAELTLFLAGRYRSIYVCDAPEFDAWLHGLQRPPARTLTTAIDRILNMSVADLQLAGHRWKLLQRTVPPIYEVRYDQARVYCVWLGDDLVIVGWEQKKRDKPDQRVLGRARRIALEVLDGR